MSLLKRLSASETNLVGPNFKKAEYLKIDLSGTSVFFKNPPLTCMIPYKPPITSMDINTPHSFMKPIHEHELVMSRELNENGWNFYSGFNSDSSFGGMIASLFVFKSLENHSSNKSFFKKNYFLEWNLKEVRTLHEWLNKRRIERHEDNPNKTHLYTYPASAKDISINKYNNYTWYSYKVYDSDGTEEIIYRTPISHDTLLSLVIQPNCYRDDYHSSNHNLVEMVNKTIEELMQSMEIELSPDKVQQAKDANSEILALEDH